LELIAGRQTVVNHKSFELEQANLMAMIECPECNSSVSDQANACIRCGFPLEKHLGERHEIDAAEKFAASLGNAPDFAIGKQVVNWGGNASIMVEADFQFGEMGSLEPGKVQILRHRSGIKLVNSLWKIPAGYDISFLQIAEIKQMPAEEVVREERSVIGRGIVGGVLLGGSAAVVGALSGLDKSKLKKLTVTELYFFDPEARRIRGVVFRGDRMPSKAFFEKVKADSTLKIQ
jgi:hypothetical protein